MSKTRVSPSEALQWLYEHPTAPVAVDTESRPLAAHKEQLLSKRGLELKLGISGVADGRSVAIGVSLTYKDGEGYFSTYVPINHEVGENCDLGTWKKLKYVLRQGRVLIFANAPFDFLSLETVKIRAAEMPFYDIQTVANIARPHFPFVKSLDMLARAYLGEDEGKVEEWPYVELNEKGRPVKETTLDWQKKNGWPDTTPEMIFHYACTDTEQTYMVWEKLMVHPGWTVQPENVWADKQETIRIITEMKRRGILVDIELAAQLQAEGEAAKEDLLEKLEGLNPSSVKDIPVIMLEKLGLPILKETPAGKPSFTKEVMAQYDEILENLDRDDPEIGYVRAWRGWTTALGLLLRPYQERVSPDGRLRTSYTTHVTSTGRLSSKEPNLQQISKGDDPKPWNDRVKKCFVPKPGFTLLSADYSQLELRLAVAYAQEPELIKVFEEGRDIFDEMAAEMGWPRKKTKGFVYAVQYGAGDAQVARIFGVSLREAKKLREKFYHRYPRFRAVDESCRQRVGATKSLKLWSGRVRHFQSKDDNYKAMNALLQGGGADVVEKVWAYVMKHVDNEDCRTLLQVHDALVFEVKNEHVDHYRKVIEETMSDVNGICSPDPKNPLFPVKFAVDVTVWGED